MRDPGAQESGEANMEAERIGRRKWKGLKERLALIGCCASAWGLRASHPATATLDAEEAAEEHGIYREHREGAHAAAGGTVEEMNLASALAAERQHRAGGGGGERQDEEGVAPVRVSLMRLLVELEAEEKRDEESAGGGGEGGEGWCWCCVCLGRRKGAALIPCGHTFCRVCSRELWLNRGTCPLCNHPIIDILDIF